MYIFSCCILQNFSNALKRIFRNFLQITSQDIERMKKMICYLICQFILIVHCLQAQEQPVYEWWSLPLMSKYTLIHSYPMFHGYPIGWRPKGFYTSMQLIDGIDFHSGISMTPSYKWFSHLQFNSQSISYQKEYAEQSILRNTNNDYLQFNFQNNISLNTAGFQYKQEKITKSLQWGINGVVLDKLTKSDWLGPHQQLGVQGYLANASDHPWRWMAQFSLNHQEQAVQSATAKEVFDIVKTTNYNPNWGWYHGNMLFADIKSLNALVAQFVTERKWSKFKYFKWSLAFVKLEEDRNALTWVQSRDPRPDYYRYLPSYQKGSTAQENLFSYLSSHPQKMQLNFDQLEKTNLNANDGYAKYVMSKSKEKGLQFKTALQFHLETKSHFVFNSRLHLGFASVNHSNQLTHLLGGKFFYNRLQWINESESGNEYLANVNDTTPLQLGGFWGPHFVLKNISAQSHNEITWQWAKGEWGLEWWHHVNQYARESTIQNQLFLNSKGSQALPKKWDHMIALRSTYMFNGRWFMNGLMQFEQYHKEGDQFFLDPDVGANLTRFQSSALRTMYLVGLNYSGITLDGKLELYQQSNLGLNGHHSFYHDYYNVFVYGIYGQMNVQTIGLDWSLEKDWFGIWKAALLGSFKNEFISNQPIYEIRNVNDLFKMESGRLLLKGLPFANNAMFSIATTISYKPNLNWQFNIDQIWAGKRPVRINYFRRTDWVKQKLSDSVWQRILQVENLPAISMLQCTINHFKYAKQDKKLIKWQWKLQLQYFLSKEVPALYVNESTRFDYKNFSINKFPAKWFMQQPFLLNSSIIFQIQ